jgi:hypothetical protein
MSEEMKHPVNHRINSDPDEENSDRIVKDQSIISNYLPDIENGEDSVSVSSPILPKLNYPSERELGYVFPLRCGHRGYPKEKDKEKRAFDILLSEYGFKSNPRCIHPASSDSSDSESVNESEENEDENVTKPPPGNQNEVNDIKKIPTKP